ncbi:hypothetical protein KGF54_000441 [Candida jiufengensis]|uniref:uncharacterized protein n=1 Tax=Candida jiufengensis TaxID=497108 RepID=UPI0022259941|nr:uncharacterized protein KGF54_000441 [Candida jiufengensis]KAI5956823.1 hypothetical protein KGF54_000441 [Candida jiufengensis]
MKFESWRIKKLIIESIKFYQETLNTLYDHLNFINHQRKRTKYVNSKMASNPIASQTSFMPDQFSPSGSFNQPTDQPQLTRSLNSWSTNTSQSQSQSSSTSGNTYSFIGNTPSSILFFVALAVGVFIGFLFIFFTIRYFVRSKYGITVIPINRRSFNGGGIGSINEHAFAHIFNSNEIQEQISRGEIMEQTLNLRDRNRQRRNRRRRKKMKKLTEVEVEKLFPKKTYLDWLEGGKERDVEHRDGILEEEPVQIQQPQDINDESINSLYTAREENDQEIELKNIKTNNNIMYTEQDITDCSKSNNDDHSLHFDSGSCAICLEIIEEDELVRGLICGHVFHSICLDPWLTKRRACCPMCKRDYRFKKDYQTDNNNNDNNNENDDNDLINDLNQIDSDQSLDLDEIRNDPAVQALLQDLIPIGERVRILLNDSNYSHLNLDERGKQISKKKYGRFLKKLMWKIFGISQQDLYNWAVMDIIKKYRRDNPQQTQPQQEQQETEHNQDRIETQTQQVSQPQTEETRESVENRV